ncbi:MULTISPECIES: ribosome small subunit-dependent GTPase A [Planomicrobium]|uniref:Small ribosomal subunit biogenesis GTPase RsgA n=1 Tax=Planomicrobium okeanokoites TaxID=244 RepID=A0ABV7KPC5_PLAOK|nr:MULTISPECIES: ribosome small subunit-dependent GTPase A [Planomicrobium]PKH09790.1 ribosome small subunit-dependent GTPase A [Planomicrobium sp. MB-3u-38]TAA71423.1 ribosome small subunit-dependent GTPase A [Planomicrobium okeanokoites]
MPKGQIRKALSGFYYVLDEDGERYIQCRGRGVFRNRQISPLVGDFVDYKADNDLEGTILHVYDRKNELVRPPIANIDQAILVFSAKQPDFHPLLLDRFLTAIESHDIQPVICLTKMDLVNDEERSAIMDYIADYEKIGYEVIPTFIDDPELQQRLMPVLENRTSVLAGQSGVGKSTMLNTILPSLELKTDDISKALNRGKHTTRHVELIEVNSGLLADTPGFSSFDFDTIEKEELSGCFPEMAERSNACKFRECLHLNEPKCAIKKAVDTGEIPEYRYKHYLKFLEEIMTRKPRYSND